MIPTFTFGICPDKSNRLSHTFVVDPESLSIKVLVVLTSEEDLCLVGCAGED